MDIIQSLQAAEGYAMLGMHIEAIEELEKARVNFGEHPDLLEAALKLLMRKKAWDAAIKIGRKLCSTAPHLPVGFLHTAYCLHEQGRTEEAKSVLLQGPPDLENEAAYHYNLGCYNAILGNKEAARDHVLQSFKINKGFRQLALDDPDLNSIREFLD